NAPIHTSQYSQQGFEACSISTLRWPAQSPELMPIENLWSYLKQRLYKANQHLSALQGGPETIKEKVFLH
ncbi:hypothetical protein IE53DRAFT_316953, partial [Violaceomyces palustris]